MKQYNQPGARYAIIRSLLGGGFPAETMKQAYPDMADEIDRAAAGRGGDTVPNRPARVTPTGVLKEHFDAARPNQPTGVGAEHAMQLEKFAAAAIDPNRVSFLEGFPIDRVMSEANWTGGLDGLQAHLDNLQTSPAHAFARTLEGMQNVFGKAGAKPDWEQMKQNKLVPEMVMAGEEYLDKLHYALVDHLGTADIADRETLEGITKTVNQIVTIKDNMAKTLGRSKGGRFTLPRLIQQGYTESLANENYRQALNVLHDARQEVWDRIQALQMFVRQELPSIRDEEDRKIRALERAAYRGFSEASRTGEWDNLFDLIRQRDEALRAREMRLRQATPEVVFPRQLPRVTP